MVCVAAFIILVLVGVFVLLASIFNKSLGAKYLKALKKSFGCLGKKIRLQKCETNFKDDVKNAFLKKVVLTHPKLVWPISALIEIVSVLLVLITIWSIVEVIKAGLALWVFGTCNVSQPAQCGLASEICSIDGAEEPQNPGEYIGRWFSEWGQIFQTIPEKFHDYKAEDYAVEPYTIVGGYSEGREYALDVFDPGCAVCMTSYRNELSSGFFDKYNVILMIDPIKLPDGKYKFNNSEIIARYFYAAKLAGTDGGEDIIKRLFTDSDEKGVNYQSVFRDQLSEEEAEKKLQGWLANFGISKTKIAAIKGMAHSERVTGILEEVGDNVTNKLRAKGIPALVYNNQLHVGLYEK